MFERLKNRLPRVGKVIDFFVRKAREEEVVYADGTKETVRYGDGILRDKAVISFLVTILISKLNLDLNADVATNWVVDIVNVIGVLVTGKLIRDKYELK